MEQEPSQERHILRKIGGAALAALSVPFFHEAGHNVGNWSTVPPLLAGFAMGATGVILLSKDYIHLRDEREAQPVQELDKPLEIE